MSVKIMDPCKEMARAWSGTYGDHKLSKYSSWEGRGWCVLNVAGHAASIIVKPVFVLLLGLAVFPLHLHFSCCGEVPRFMQNLSTILDDALEIDIVSPLLKKIMLTSMGDVLGTAIVSPWTEIALTIRALVGIFHPGCYYKAHDKTSLGKDPRAIELASPTLQNNKEVALAAVKKDGWLLRFASPALQNDPDIAFAAVANNGRTLPLVSHELRNNPQIVLEALRNRTGRGFCSTGFFSNFGYGGHLLRYADYLLMSDRAFMLDAIEEDENSLKLAHDDLLGHDFYLEAIKRNGLAIKYLPDTEKSDETTALIALTSNGLALEHLSERQKNNQKLVLAAIDNQPQAFEFSSPELMSDAGFLLNAARQNGFILLASLPKRISLTSENHLDFSIELIKNIVQRLKLLTRSEQKCQLSKIRSGFPKLAKGLEIVLQKIDRPMFKLANIHFKFSSPQTTSDSF